jgi:hypothetical protein
VSALQPARGQSFSPAKSSGKSWTSNAFEQFVFIENKGQIDASVTGTDKSKREPVYFTANSHGVDLYFSRKGLTYTHDEFKTKLSEEDREKLEQKGNGQLEKAI